MRSALAPATVFAAALALAPAGACATRGLDGSQSVVDVNVAPLGSLPRTEIRSSAEASADGRCVLTVTAGEVEKSSAGCYLDSHIAKVSGTLTYPCGGSGAAEADFGDDHYAGRVENGRLSLERTTELDWEDGCRWGTHATLEGALARGIPASAQSFSWAYVDRIVSGDGCSGICRAHASVEGVAAGIPARIPTKKEAPDD